MKPQSYTKLPTKPVQVKAMKFRSVTGAAQELMDWMSREMFSGVHYHPDERGGAGLISLQTPAGTRMWVAPGDYLVHEGDTFYPVKPDIFERHFEVVTPQLQLSDANRRILFKVYDDGDGGNITIEPGGNGWFIGTWDGEEVCRGVEHDGLLYVVTNMSGGGLFHVIAGYALADNEIGRIFPSQAEAIAYVEGRIDQ